ncbi:MAG: enoyl-CoA hydratase/isomerase family protein [Synergistaceae bacterium]|jgi:enoyl-CoA hydratase|nr:enoyl-CoA hydratase/isomerase family protein [Synergistaceae bacterium]
MEFRDIIYEVRDHIAFITIDRPKALNALLMNTKRELEDAIDAAGADDDVLGVIITGNGRAFCAGTDISEIPVDEAGVRNMSKKAHILFNKFDELGKPIIAAVNGYALGGGSELVLACDIVVASSRAKFGMPEIDLGVNCCYGGTQRLPRLVGPMVAKELLFTGRQIDAEEAKALGMVNRIVEPADVLVEAEKLMREIIGKAPIAVKYNKYLINKGLDKTLPEALDYEEEISGIVFTTEDAKEGLKAFLEKRKPVFRGK